jgi:hypothetical protein
LGSLFTNESGRPLRYGAWKDQWLRASTATALDLTTHDLRHYFASLLIANGASVKQVQMVLATPARSSRSGCTRTCGPATTTACRPSPTPRWTSRGLLAD